jgi:hypothetical protein
MEKFTIEQLQNFLRVEKEIICSLDAQLGSAENPFWIEDTSVSSSSSITSGTSGLMNN